MDRATPVKENSAGLSGVIIGLTDRVRDKSLKAGIRCDNR